MTRATERPSPVPPSLDDRHPDDRLERTLSLTDATLLVVSSVIGVGIFLTPGVVAANLPHPGLFLLAWALGGLLSLAGALANAELGAMYPHAGGDYVYLREAYHPAAGFLIGWLSFFVIYAGTVATLAIGFAEGLGPFFDLGTTGKVGIAVALTAATSWINYVGVRPGALVNNLSAALKVATLGGLGVVGWLFAPQLAPGAGAESFPPGEASVAGFGLAMSPVLFSYLGWNASVYVASEIRTPQRNLPRSLFLGLGVCTSLYLLLNALYLHALPMEVFAGEPRAGEAAAVALFGPLGGTIVALLILLSVLGCLNATILVGPRIAYAMALDGLFFAGSERVHDRFRTPHVAIVVQAATAIALVLVLQRFPRVLDYTTFAIVLATIADTSALYALRWRRPEMPRSYRAWGYPVVPALYLAANVAIAVAMLWGRPLESAVALLVTASGLPFLAFFARRAASRRPRAR
ncbi:MAG: APC family permease [Thermodesulfobacteriota bacterium]